MPKKPDTTPETTDADEPVATVEFDWRGVTFTLPKDMDDWEITACIALTDAARSNQLKDLLEALRLSLGEQQWEILQSLGTRRRDLTAFATEFGRVVDEDCV